MASKRPYTRRKPWSRTRGSADVYRVRRAELLDRAADAELQHGHHAAAERLAHQAADLREAGQ